MKIQSSVWKGDYVAVNRYGNSNIWIDLGTGDGGFLTTEFTVEEAKKIRRALKTAIKS